MDFEEILKPAFCKGCGNFLIYASLRNALVKAQIKKEDVLMVFDVGCSGNYADKINANSVHTLHGRSTPFACGAKIANKDKFVIVNAGDGALFHEGINHLIEAAQNNIGILVIVHNNNNFALTKGQKIYRKDDFGINLMKNCGVKFAHLVEKPRLNELSDLFYKALFHKGFAYVEVKQLCPTF